MHLSLSARPARIATFWWYARSAHCCQLTVKQLVTEAALPASGTSILQIEGKKESRGTDLAANPFPERMVKPVAQISVLPGRLLPYSPGQHVERKGEPTKRPPAFC